MRHRNGETVAAFEREFAAYVGAKYAIALCNGTATLHTALVALGVKPGYEVAVPPLSMSSTTLAVLHAGAVPVFGDVRPDTWLMDPGTIGEAATDWFVAIPVSLYGLHQRFGGAWCIDDAAQTLRHHGDAASGIAPAFTSYSFQASKILALGEGGMLVTNDEALATKAREFSSLGYRMRADQPRIDPAVLKSSTYERHHSIGYNYRMNDVTAAEGLRQLPKADSVLLYRRQHCADYYREAIQGCDWLTPQHVPEGWTHDYWAYAVACDTHERSNELSAAVVRHNGERPYGAWLLAFQEPALRHLDHGPEACPVALSLQPRILQFQTNNLASAEQNARALRLAIEEMSA